MIAIMGATSTIGSALLRNLAQLGVPARALSREPEKLRAQLAELEGATLEVKAADASDPESLRRAFTGASQLFLSMSNSLRQVEWETSIIRIAAEAGITHIVKLSSPAFEPSAPVAIAEWHAEIEQVLFSSGVTATVLRPYAFMQNLLRFTPTVALQNVFFGTMGEAACNFIDCRDIADVAAAVLTKRELTGRVYTLTGSEAFSYPQIASKLSEQLGREIRYVNLEPEALYRSLREYGGLPHFIASHVVEIQTMARLVPERPVDTVQQLLGREPRKLDDFLRENRERF